MCKTIKLAIFTLVTLVFLMGCASGGVITSPDGNQDSGGDTQPGLSGAAGESGRYLWSFNYISIDPETLDYEVIATRVVSGHWNTLSWLEQWPCSNCFKLVGITPTGNGTIDVDVQITHPFTNANFTGFDVRGIAMFEGSHIFPVSGIGVSDRTSGEGEMVNADGFTQLYNINTAGGGPGGLQGYIKGKLASDIPPTTTLNGYKRYISDDPGNIRNCFYAGDVITTTFEIDMPDVEFIFGYAVDGCWATPTVKPVTDPITQFPIEANCPEPWKIEITEDPPGGELSLIGGTLMMIIDVYDRQGKDSHLAPVVECPEIFDGTVTATHVSSGPGYSRWEAEIKNDLVAGLGDYLCLVSVEDNENATAPYYLDLTAYQIYKANVGPSQVPIAISTVNPNPQKLHQEIEFSDDGSYDPDGGSIIEYGWDLNGNHIVDVYGTPVTYQYESPGIHEVTLQVRDDQGQYGSETIDVEVLNSGWVRTTGAESGAGIGSAVAVDSNSYVYVTGSFNGTPYDHDPGYGEELYSSYGHLAGFLSCYNPQGSLQWVQCWSGNFDINAWDIAVDNVGGVYVVGTFNGIVVFDPYGAMLQLTSNGEEDVYMAKFSDGGSFQWASHWGSVEEDWGASISVNESNIVVCGSFRDTLDFDPTGGVASRTPVGGTDVYVSVFNLNGWFQRVMTWGSDSGDKGYGVEIDEAGLIHTVGYFQSTCDFDPSLGTDILDSENQPGGYDAFLSKTNVDGSYYWARNWGDGLFQIGIDARTDESDNVYVGGWFWGLTDFDPGSGVAWEESDCKDGFLSKFDTDGEFQWVRVWVGTGCDDMLSMEMSDSGAIDLVGNFTETMDFDPGPGLDEKTSAGDEDIFITRYDQDGNYQWSRTWGGTGVDDAFGVGLQSNGNTYVTGEYRLTVDWDPEFETYETTANGARDFYIVKLFNDGYW